MIGANYQAKAIAAVLGSSHSAIIPEGLWGAWLDVTLTVIEDTGIGILHSAFEETATGVANTSIIDAGTMPASTPTHFALMDASVGGEIVAYVPITFAVAPTVGDAVAFPPGSLVFEYVVAP